MEHEIVVCQCGSTEHQIIFAHDTDDKVVYMSIHLTSHGFWGRLKEGLKYIFGHKSKYGAFDEVILNGDDHLKQFENVVKTLKEEKIHTEELHRQGAERAAASLV